MLLQLCHSSGCNQQQTHHIHLRKHMMLRYCCHILSLLHFSKEMLLFDQNLSCPIFLAFLSRFFSLPIGTHSAKSQSSLPFKYGFNLWQYLPSLSEIDVRYDLQLITTTTFSSSMNRKSMTFPWSPPSPFHLSSSFPLWMITTVRL